MSDAPASKWSVPLIAKTQSFTPHRNRPEELDFARMTDQRFRVRSVRAFDAVAALMNRRFAGLPRFHHSVKLSVLEDRKLIEGQRGPLTLPRELGRLVAPHLEADVQQLLGFANRKKGTRTLGMLRLGIRLDARYTTEHIEREGVPQGALMRSLTRFFGHRLQVPVVLAVASRQDGDHYESLAVGVRGVTRYCSALFVSPMGEPSAYRVEGGLEASVAPEHIDHPISALLTRTGRCLLPEKFFDRYLEHYMVPERETIVTRLCRYVFSGLECADADPSGCEVVPVSRLKLA